MKLASIVVLCLAVCLHQAAAKPFFFDAIGDGIRTAGSVAEGIVDAGGSVASGAVDTAGSIASGIAEAASGAAKGAIGTATGITKGVIGVGTGIASGIADQAASATKAITEIIQNTRNRALKGALQQAQNTLQRIQDSSRGTLQASEIAAKNAQDGIIELEDRKDELINQWADEARSKLENASDDTKEKGEDLINAFGNRTSEEIKQASDEVLQTLEDIQEKAHATADEYHGPMNKLIEQVGKCSEIKASQIRELIKCSKEILKDLEPLASAPRDLLAVRAQFVKVAGQNIVKDIRVQGVINQFRNRSKQVDTILDQLVAQDQQNQGQDQQNEGQNQQNQEEDQQDQDNEAENE